MRFPDPRTSAIFSGREPHLVPILRSPRPMSRALCAADHAALLAMAHDAEVTRYLHEGPAPSADDVRDRVARAAGRWDLRGYGMMAVEDADGFVGRPGVYHPADAADPLRVYALCRRGWGKGYATEGVGLFRGWMHATHKTRHPMAHIDPRNSAPARVAAKLGAGRDGTAIRGGTTLDVWVFPTVS